MSSKFVKRVTADLQRQVQAMQELRTAAEQIRQMGNWQSYWDLIVPGTEGELYALLGRDAEATAFFRAAVQYFDSYRTWAISQGQSAEITPYEAGMCLKAGFTERARAMYRHIAAQEDDLGKSMLGIVLINTGAVEEGMAYLRWRVTHLERGAANTPTRWYHLAECYWWLGDRERSHHYATQAIKRSSDASPDPPFLALAHLTRYALTAQPSDKDAAAQALAASVRWFYFDHDLPHARDAREYLRLLDKIQHREPITGLPIIGMSFMHG